ASNPYSSEKALTTHEPTGIPFTMWKIMSRRRTRGGSDPPEERLRLRVSLEEARQLIGERISEGQTILEVRRPADFSAAATRWDRYNRDLISEHLFESED